MENKAEGHLQAPPLPKQLFESSGMSQEMRQGHKNGSIEVCFMSNPGTRPQKFEGGSPGTGINDTSNRVPTNSQSAALNLNGRPPSRNTILTTTNEASPLVVTTVIGASRNVEVIPRNSLHSAGQSSSVINGLSEPKAHQNRITNPKPLQQAGETHERVVLVCKSCAGNFEKKRQKTYASLDEWLHSDMCSNCLKMVSNAKALNTLQDPKGQITTADHQTGEEEVNSCCCF